MSFSDLFKESLRPFGSPSTLFFDQKAQKAQNKLGDVFNDELTRGQITHLGDVADDLGGLRSRVQASIGNEANRVRATARRQSSGSVAAALNDQAEGAVNSGDIVSNALRRAKARQGILMRGDAAGRNQALRNRLEEVRTGISSSGRAIQTQTQGQNIMSGVNVASDSARARGDAAVAGALGGVAGGLAATLKNNKQSGGGFFDFKLGGHT